MARIQQYSTDTTITGGDKLVGNDAADNSTKLFQISDIGLHFAKQGNGTGYQYTYGGKYTDSSVGAGSIEYLVDPTAPSQFGWANIQKIAFSNTIQNGTDVSGIYTLFTNQIIKVTDLAGDGINSYAIYKVTNIEDTTGGKLVSVTMLVGSGTPAEADVVVAFSGIVRAEDINAITDADVVDNLLSQDGTKVLSAKQGNVLKGLIDTINGILASNDASLDTIQEIVDYIKANNASIASLNTTMATKEDKVAGKGLSTEDFTSALLAKLNSIATNAEVNVQSNWNESDNTNDAFIQNKPAIASPSTTLTVSGTTNEIEVTGGAQDLSANRTWTVGLPNDVTIASDLTVGDSIQLSNAQSSTPTFDNGIYFSTESGNDTLHFRYDDKDLSIDYLTEVLSTGILNGGELSVANGTQFTIAAGDGIINDINKASGSDPHPEIKKISWSQQTITVSNLDSSNTQQLNSWIYVDANGAIQQQATAFTDAQKRNNITIGSAIHSEGVLKFVKTFPITAYDNTSQINEFANIFGPLKKSGHKVTANGANLSINRAAGVAFALGRNYAADPENPSTVSDSAKTQCVIHRYYRNNSGGFVLDDGPSGNGYTVLDPTKYDNGSGTLQNVTSTKFAVQRLFYFPGTPNIVVSYYGHNVYDSLIDAEKEYILEDFLEAENTSNQAIYLGAIIMKGDASALNNATQAKILTAGAFRGLASVDLGGVSASASLGDLQDVNIASVANGQVLKYNSTSGKWENQADAGGTITGTGAANKLAIWNNTNSLTNDTDLHWDSSNSRLGVGVSSPLYNIDIDGGTSSASPTVRFKNTSYGDWIFTRLYGNMVLFAPSASDKFYVANASSGPGGPSDSQLNPIVVSQVGVKETSPTVAIDAGNATDAVKLPNGTTAQRPTAAAGMLRYNTTDGQFEGYTTEWGPIGGGGGGTSTIQRDTFSGNGSTTQFTLSASVSDEINTQVYIDGVYQSKLNYSTSGNVLTFSSAPPSGTNNIEVIHVTSVTVEGASALNKNTFTGDGSTTGFTLSAAPTSEDFTFVFIQGVYQEKSTYVVANNIITFSTAPQNGYTIEVMHINAVNVQQSSYMEYDGFTGTGSQTAFTLVNGNPTDEKFTMVFLQGVYQEKSTYSLANRTITFTTAPDLNYTIEVISINGGGLLTNPSTRPTVGVITANTTAVANSVYVLKASLTLTLPANPQIGDSVKVSNRSGTTTCVIGANNKKIMGAAANLTLDTASASFELIYSGVDEGWVIIGQ